MKKRRDEYKKYKKQASIDHDAGRKDGFAVRFKYKYETRNYQARRIFFAGFFAGGLTAEGWAKFKRSEVVPTKTGAANESGTCIIDAIKIASKLLDHPKFAAADRVQLVKKDCFNGKFPKIGLNKAQMYRLIDKLNEQCHDNREPKITLAYQNKNIIQNPLGGCIRINVDDGVYLALGSGHYGEPGHAFVLHVHEGIRGVYDPLQYDGAMAWHTNNLSWIHHWEFIYKFTVKKTYALKTRKGRGSQRKRKRTERRVAKFTL